MLYQNYQIEKDMDELRKDVLASGGHYSDQELKEKLKAVDNLESDQKMFMIMTAMIPLVVAGGAMGAAGNCADCHIGNDYSSFLIILGYQKSRY